jgi:predicted Zn-dependent protease
VAQQPDSPLVLFHVGTLEREAGNLGAAIALLKHGLAVNPRDPQTAAFLGRTLVEAGRAGEAVAALAPLVADPRPDVDVLMAQGAAPGRVGPAGRGALGP